MNIKRVKELLYNFPKKKIVVVGDINLDKEIYGTMYKISNEAPVPVVIEKGKEKGEKYFPGGAGNTVYNVNSLGGIVYPVAVIGDDESGRILIKKFLEKGIDISGLLIDPNRETHTYTKIIADVGPHSAKNQILRLDTKKQEKINKELENKLLEVVERNVKEFDAIIVSDYSKGIVTSTVIKKISELGRKYAKFTIGDSREKLKEFINFSVVVPNDYEAASTVERVEEDYEINNEKVIRNGKKLLEMLNNDAVIITKGKEGMSIFQESKTESIPTYAREVFDVTGAGDTVAATVALALAAGANYFEAAKLANYAAGIVIRKPGTATVTVKEIIEHMIRFKNKVS